MAGKPGFFCGADNFFRLVNIYETFGRRERDKLDIAQPVTKLYVSPFFDIRSSIQHYAD